MPELSWAGGSLHVVRELARGGMGSVQLALREQAGFRRAFAVKRLHPSLRADTEALRRFVDEATLAAELRHPNVVSVLDVGTDAEGPFIVMELVVGLSLRELAAVAIPPQVALRILTGVAEALRAAHAHDMAHRDVSPGNVLVGFDGSVRLIDFGLARVVQDERTRELLRGTVGYMSPEQLRFESADTRTDLFSLGVLGYECLSGARLYGDEDARVAARRILSEAPPDLRAVRPELSDDLARLVSGLLEKRPEDRPMDADAACEALRRATYERVLDEGVRDVSAWMRETFPTALQAQQDVLTASWHGLRETPAPKRTEEPRRRSKAGLFMTIAALLGVATVAALALPHRAAAPVHARKAPLAPKLEAPVVEAPPPAPPTETADAPEPPEPRSTRRVRRRRGRAASPDRGTKQPERRLWRW